MHRKNAVVVVGG